LLLNVDSEFFDNVLKTFEYDAADMSEKYVLKGVDVYLYRHLDIFYFNNDCYIDIVLQRDVKDIKSILNNY